MTKGQFNRAIKAMSSSMLSIPDELWVSGCFPTISVRCGNVEAFMGLRPTSAKTKATDEEESD